MTFLPTVTSFLINGASDLTRKTFIWLQNEEPFFYVGLCCFAEGWWFGWRQRERAGKYSERRVGGGEQLEDGKEKGEKKKSILDDFKQACHNSVRGTRAVCLPHVDTRDHTQAWRTHTYTQACAHTRQYVWVSVTEGSVCTPKAVTPQKPSQNTLIKMSPTITAHPDPLTFTPPMNTVSYSVSIFHSR